jgi:hypothetical protein
MGMGITHLDAADSVQKCNNDSGKHRGPQNDSGWDWDEGSVDIPCDSHIYQVEGTVVTLPESLTIQTERGYGSGSGFMINGMGSVGWSSMGPEFSGKGFVRILVSWSDSELAPAGQVTILKVTDTKAIALLQGDKVRFKCRSEYEAVAPLDYGEKFTTETRDQAATYELDYCRLVSPVLQEVEK